MHTISPALERRKPVEGKEDFMARQRKKRLNGKRQGGTGSIVYEKNGLAIRWPEYQLLPEGGKKRIMRYEFLGAVTAREASNKLTERRARALQEGPKPVPNSAAVVVEPPEPPELTFEQYVARWQKEILESAGEGAADLYKFSTRDSWSGIIRARLKPFNNYPLSAISTEIVQGWVRQLREGGLAPATIQKYCQVLGVVLQRAVAWGNIPANPTVGVEMPKIRKKEQAKKKWALTPKQAADLIQSIQPLRPRAIVAVAIMTGLRRGELVALRWKSLDEASSAIVVTEASYRGHIDTPKTEAGERKALVNQFALDYLKRWRRLSKRTRPDDFIFGTRTGKQDSPGNLMRRYIAPACEALGFRRPFNWNLFRRTWVTWLRRQREEQEKIGPQIVAEMMGHANAKTQEIYVQSDEEILRWALENMGTSVSRYCPDESQLGLPYIM